MKLQPIWWVPSAWPLFWRRAFLITLPISGPAWMALTVIGHLGAMVVLLAMLPFMLLWTLCENLWTARSNETQ